MRLLRRASARWLARHPGQLALSVVGVALGVSVVVAIDLAIQSSRAAFRASAETVAGRATHHVVAAVGGVDETLVARLRVELGVRAAAPVVEGWASSPALPGRALRLLGIDPFSEAPFRPWVAGGAPGVEMGELLAVPGAVVLSAATAAEAGVVRGDTLPALVDGRLTPLPVAGVLAPADGLARDGLRDLLLLDVAGAQALVGAPGRLSRIDVRLEEDEGEAERVARIEAALPAGTRLVAAGTRREALAGMIDAFDLNLRALSLLALVFGMFLIYNAMTFSVVQRRELIGALRAIGVTRREVLGLVVREAAWIGVVGAAAGTGLGVLLGRGLVRMVTRTIHDFWFVLSVRAPEIPPTVLVEGLLLGVGATVLAAAGPALEAALAPPHLAQVRSTSEERARRAVPRAAGAGVVLVGGGAVILALPTRDLVVSFGALFLAILGMALLTPAGTVGLVRATRPLMGRVAGILGTMASRGVVTALSRTAPAIAALVVAVSVTVGLGVMIQSFRSSLERWLDGTLQADVYVSLPSVQASRADGTLPDGLVRELVAHPAVVGRSTYRGVEATMEGGPARLVALDLDRRGEAAFDFLEGEGEAAFRAFRAGEGALVSEPFAYRRGLALGDPVRVPAPRGTWTLSVAGVFRDYGSDQGVVMVDRAAYDAVFPDRGVTSLGLFLTDGADADGVVRELGRRVPEGLTVSIRTHRALRRGSLEVFDRTFQVTAVLRLLAFVVAFVGVLAALMALELERARELGVLRANGLTPAQVWHLVTAQTGLMGFVAGVLAVPVGLALAAVMIFVVNKRSFGWTLRMEVGGEVVLQAVGLALVGALVAGIVPAWRMARTSPAEALRGE